MSAAVVWWPESCLELAQTLQALERDGFVHREARPTIPPHVEYTLTPMGREVPAGWSP